MTALRMTALPTPAPRSARRPGVRFLLSALGLGVALAAGCNRSDREPAPPPAGPAAGEPNPRQAQLPPPQAADIKYDAASRTLEFYVLPAPARWVVAVPGVALAAQAGPKHRVPENADPEHTLVYISHPGGAHSPPVTLRRIQASQEAHASNIRFK